MDNGQPCIPIWKPKLQKKGGPIGLKLTGEIADYLMINWEKQLLEKLKQWSMILEVYTRFKDCHTNCYEKFGKWLNNFLGQKNIYEDKKLVDETKTESQVTMGIIQEVVY